MTLRLCLFFILFLTVKISLSQQELQFRQLTVSQGLNDGFINAIGQDKYGFTWFGSLGGLNRYNGSSMRFYHHIPGKAASPRSGLALSMASDASGRFWIGFDNGLSEYDFATSGFINYPLLNGFYINKIFALSADRLLLATNTGLLLLDSKHLRLIPMEKAPGDQDGLLFKTGVFDLSRDGKRVLISGWAGLFSYDPAKHKFERIRVNGYEKVEVKAACVDLTGNLWIALAGETRLLRQSADGLISDFSGYIGTNAAAIRNNVNGLLQDQSGNVWIITNHDGVLRYDATSDRMQKFIFQQGMPHSLSENLARSIFEDRYGTIWIGGSQGCNYTQPSKALFTTILPFADSLDTRNRRIARGIDIDKQGNWWMTTGDGMVRYTPSFSSYKTWNNKPGQPNQVYYNSIRGVACDIDNNVWIGTGEGVNCYRSSTGKMEFISYSHLPKAFYFSVNEDRRGRIWFGCRDFDGCYFYDPASKTFHSIRELPGMDKMAIGGVRYVFEDSRGRYWFGYNGEGLGVYDPVKETSRFWNSRMPAGSSITGDLVIDIKEDKNGVVWISTTNGVTGISPELGKLYSFNRDNGLLSSSASGLAVDALNRLWIATTRGVNMLDSGRTIFRSFGMSDGLPTDQFPEHPGIQTKEGDIIFPSFNGFVKFNPLAFSNDSSGLPVYLDAIKIRNRLLEINNEISDLQQLNLQQEDNAFSLSFAIPNFYNPAQNWYAYKLDGFDKDWTYTQKNEISYTNVPGGNYRFLYKTSVNPGDWKVKEKILKIHIDTVFYKTVWFRLLVVIMLASFLYTWYRSRLMQQKQVLDLKSKAQLLEKEKVQVMYENLKQHLNPHFLFNSLTSLSSLIRLDQQQAVDFLGRMSKIYRYILKNRDSETVSLKEELEFTGHYIQLQKTRFEDALQVNNKIPEEDHDKRLAPVTIQNLVENAIKHNLLSKSKPLVITLKTEDDYLVVWNNLQEKNFVETSNKQGLESMRSLYVFMTDRPMIVEKNDHSFTVKIPLV